MPDATVIAVIQGTYRELLDDLDERGRQRWAAVEARALGRGGIAVVAQATGLSDRMIRNGLKELDPVNPIMVIANDGPAADANLTRIHNRNCVRLWSN